MSQHEDLITLVDEEGQEHHFMVLDMLKLNGQDYAVLIPVAAEELPDQEAEEQEVVIFRLVPDGEELALLVVDDEAEWQSVAVAWEEGNADVWADEEEEETEQ